MAGKIRQQMPAHAFMPLLPSNGQFFGCLGPIHRTHAAQASVTARVSYACVFSCSWPTRMPTQAACPPLSYLELCFCAKSCLARLRLVGCLAVVHDMHVGSSSSKIATFHQLAAADRTGKLNMSDSEPQCLPDGCINSSGFSHGHHRS